ncbi:MAG: hypothetical protein JKX81_03450 [Arenicella sp.]|nr:hypothetical protein [Arenicella sp.]
MLDKVYSSSWSNRHCRLLTLASLALLSGCASSIVVKPDIPNPLVERLSLNTNLVYSDTFKNYVYVEKEKKRSSMKSIDFTDAQTAMFERVFGSLTNLVESEDPSKNLSIEPVVLDFQYSAPSETKLKQYEIWIKYRLKLRDGNDARIADWTIKGYGKTPTSMLTSASSAFNAATNIALRDVGAQLSIRFPQQSVVKTLLDGGAPPTIPEPEPEEPLQVAANNDDTGPTAAFLDELPDFEQGEVNGSLSAPDTSVTPTAERAEGELEENLGETDQEDNDEI